MPRSACSPGWRFRCRRRWPPRRLMAPRVIPGGRPAAPRSISGLKVVNRPKRAKNVILLVGDGMGIATITAARMFDGQRPVDGRKPSTGEENVLSLRSHALFGAGQDLQHQRPGGGQRRHRFSALNTGVKTRIGVINFGESQFADACKTPQLLPKTFAERAKQQGMAVGIVTTTR